MEEEVVKVRREETRVANAVAFLSRPSSSSAVVHKKLFIVIAVVASPSSREW